MSPIVSTQWLAAHLPDVKLVDASWYMPGEKRDPRTEFAARHISGAVFFDIDAIADQSCGLPHMMPSPGEFTAAMNTLGISNGDTVVTYDGSGIFSSPRAWWALRSMGHEKVAVLDGGLPKWIAEGHPTVSGTTTPSPGSFTASPVTALVRDFDSVLKHLHADDAQILDARSASRFTGAEKEPRAGLKSGHMPGAINLHYRALLTADGTLKSEEELRGIFSRSGVELNTPIVTTCGSGISAAILMLALEKLGAVDVALYDGSWAQWGGKDGAPITSIETGCG